MSEKLKACPFCGGEAFVHILGNEIAKGYYIACDECGVKTIVFGYETKAIEAWNRRAVTDKNVVDKERTAKVVHKQQTYIVTPPKSTTIAYETETNLWDECGNCGAMGMYHGWKYCPKCGAKLEWSE